MLGKSYIPCLRWKKGEYLAIEQLSSLAHNYILPLIEVAEIGFDFEKRKENKSIDEHLNLFAKRIKGKWGTDKCFIDPRIINSTVRMKNGDHPVTYIFNDLRAYDINALPVAGVDRDAKYLNAVHEIIEADKRGLCIRIGLEEATEPNFLRNLDDLIHGISIKLENCDFVLDLGAPPNFEPITEFANLIETVIKDLPHLNYWRSFGILGTSFPSSLGGIKSGVSLLPRKEWILYKELVQSLQKSNVRIPSFGDYVINHPDVVYLDMRIIKPKANVRYTLGDCWLLARGKNVRDFGLGQHKDLCNLIINHHEFYGASFSTADKYIQDCAQGNVSTGNLTTWRRIGTNHHIELVARDAANLAAS
ncbi:MAG: beta family protein [Anaerolineae bacterium]|nr:beta family protein [Anaerolineae bacterium]